MVSSRCRRSSGKSGLPFVTRPTEPDRTSLLQRGAAVVSLRDTASTRIWGLGIRLRNLAKRLGVLGPVEPVLLKLAPLLIRPPAHEVQVVLAGDMTMVVPPGFPSARSYAAGLYEPDLTALFEDTVKQGMTVVDVGANVGYYSLIGSRLVGSSGRVYSFEPDPRNFAYLQRNLETNGCKNAVPVRKAVSHSTGSATFVVDRHGAEGHLASPSRASSATTEVETVSLDDFFAAQGWPAVDVIKMDIEGGEPAALHGMSGLAHRSPRLQVVMEFNLPSLQRAGTSREALVDLLEQLGFRTGSVVEEGLRPFSLASGFPTTRATYNLLLRRD